MGFHPGIDTGCPIDTPIYATAPGTVLYTGNTTGGWGYLVVLDHGIDPRTGNRVYTMYEHNTARLSVSYGDIVSQWDQLARSGNTGKSTNAHSHYTILEVPPGVDNIFTTYTNEKGKQVNCRVNDSLRQQYSVNPLMFKWWN